MTTSTDDIREKIYEAVDGWRFEQEWLASKAKDFPEHKGAGCGCLVCQKMDGLNTQATDYIMSLITAHGDQQATETAKAYGGCTNCYGKGYATVKSQIIGYGTDGDIGGYEGKYKRDVPVQMNFCNCERGKQLKEVVAAYGIEQRIDELNSVQKYHYDFSGETMIAIEERLAVLAKSQEGVK